MSETSKSKVRRDLGDFAKFFKGRGIDIGCAGYDAVTDDCDKYDECFGHPTAELMADTKDELYDWVYSSHCLEHIKSPETALKNWWRILKPQGYLIVVVPDFALYEHFHWPSLFNSDHKVAFSIGKSNDTFRRDIVKIMEHLENAQILRVQINEDNYVYQQKDEDQKGQREIEVIVRKQDPFWCR